MAGRSVSSSEYVQAYLGLSSTSQFLFAELGWAALGVAGVLLVALLRITLCAMR